MRSKFRSSMTNVMANFLCLFFFVIVSGNDAANITRGWNVLDPVLQMRIGCVVCPNGDLSSRHACAQINADFHI